MQQQTTSIKNKGLGLKISDKELAILYEIGLDFIPTATELVEAVSEKYAASQSGIWYTLKKLKANGLVDFAERGDSVHKPLTLTDVGRHVIRSKVSSLQNRQHYYLPYIADPIENGV